MLLALCLALALVFCACADRPENDTAPTTDTTQTTDDTVQTTDETDETDDTFVPPPFHSDLYLPDCTPQQITEYFKEVVLNVEYSDGTGSDHLVQKWVSPLYYNIYGEPTDTDIDVLNALFEQLNAIPSFPGIYPATDEYPENLSISLLDEEPFYDSFSEVINGESAYGAAQYWYYTDTNVMTDARIGCRTDIDQASRNSVLPEEIINVLGITDTVLRPDSITYQYSNSNMGLSNIDLVIFKLLYSPRIQCGMDADACALVIGQLYY